MSKTLFLVLLLLLLVGLAFSETLYLDRPKEKASEDAMDEKEFNQNFSSLRFSDAVKPYRWDVFKQNKAEIRAINKDSQSTFLAGTNNFTILTTAEFESSFLGLKIPVNNPSLFAAYPSVSFNPINWTSTITPVKNQGSCDSGWAFAAIGVIESAYKRSKKLLLDLSEQQLIDCSSLYGNRGCTGGWMSNAYAYVKAKKINLQTKYPYIGLTKTCKKITGTYAIKGYNDNTNGGCNNLLSKLANYGPVSAAVDATGWKTYKSGVFNKCSNSLNHAVVVVAGSNYQWKLKNSWGIYWGESGYIRISPGNSCNVCSYPAYVTI